MPYAFAHPAAVIPLCRLLGRFALPSALVIGSLIPDAWYLVPFLVREDSHGAAGLFLFCLPAGLFTYAAFHLIFKQPLIALFPPGLGGRLRAMTSAALPCAPWHHVAASVLAGALTHYAWDALTHPGAVVDAIPQLRTMGATLGTYEMRIYQVLQHASTLLGSAFLGWWTWRKVRRATPAEAARAQASLPARAFIVAALVTLTAIVFGSVVVELSLTPGVEGLRRVLRPAGVTALAALGLATLAYCLLWRATWAAPTRRWTRRPAPSAVQPIRRARSGRRRRGPEHRNRR